MVKQNTVQKIINFIDDYLEKTGKAFLTPPEANALLERAGILKDSKHRKGLPLRNILRDGLIPHAYQESGKKGNWKIPHSKGLTPIKIKSKQKKIHENQQKEIRGKTKPDEIKKNIQTAREKYKPMTIRCLFIAEAPPDDVKRFFYYSEIKTADYLFLGITEIIYPELKKEYLDRRRPAELKEKILQKFCSDGYYLMDVIDIPLFMYSGYLSTASSDLITRIKKIIEKNTPIILIKVTTYDAVFENLRNAGFRRIAPIRIPFPGQGQQKIFAEKFKGALKYLGLI